MRKIHIVNEKKRDATVGFDVKPKEKKIQFVLNDGSKRHVAKILKSTINQTLPVLLKKYKDMETLGKEIITSDPEIDLEKNGMILENSRKLYLSKDNEIQYCVDLWEISKKTDGTEKERTVYTVPQGNINTEQPIKFSGKKFPKSKAIKMFVFSSKYQIKHTEGLAYDFLYEIAKQLHDENVLMLVGSGKKGLDPLILTTGGTPYRGFLEGRIQGDKYCLVLHLTNLELKELINEN